MGKKLSTNFTFTPQPTTGIGLQYVRYDGRPKTRIVSISACTRVASHVDLITADDALYLYKKLSLATIRTRNKRGGIINEKAHHP